MNIAAAIVGDLDGWTLPDGQELVDVLRQRATNVETRDHDETRFEFEDGSSIVTSGGGWDFGYPASARPGLWCWCWDDGRGGHTTDCLEWTLERKGE